MSFTDIATLLLAIATFAVAKKTSDLAKENKVLIDNGDKQHRERLRPYCIPLTNVDHPILQLSEVIGRKRTIPGFPPGYSQHLISDENNAVWTVVRNSGLGPALNVKVYFTDNQGTRTTKDFLVAHILAPGDSSVLFSEIPQEFIKDDEGNPIGLSPDDMVNRIYFLICEYQSVFSGEYFHSIIANGSLRQGQEGPTPEEDQSRTPPVEFRGGKFNARPLRDIIKPVDPTLIAPIASSQDSLQT